jgi:hypothetical protein
MTLEVLQLVYGRKEGAPSFSHLYLNRPRYCQGTAFHSQWVHPMTH